MACDMVVRLARKGLVLSKTGRGREVGPFQRLGLDRALKLALKSTFVLLLIA